MSELSAIKNKWIPVESKPSHMLKTLSMDIYNNKINIIYSHGTFDRYTSKFNLNIIPANDDMRKVIIRILNPGIQHWELHLITSALSTIFYSMNPRSYKQPPSPSIDLSLESKRDNLIYDLVQRETEQKKYESDFKYYSMEKSEYYNTVVPSIGFIYTYRDEDKILFLNKENSNVLIQYYNHYKSIRLKIDKNFEANG